MYGGTERNVSATRVTGREVCEGKKTVVTENQNVSKAPRRPPCFVMKSTEKTQLSQNHVFCSPPQI